MNADARDTITWVLGTILSMCVLAGIAVRFVLMPYLREHLVKPVDEVRRATTENEHKHDPPTLPDRIENLAGDLKTLAGVLEGHLDSSERWLQHVTGRVTHLDGRVTVLERRARTHDAGDERE